MKKKIGMIGIMAFFITAVTPVYAVCPLCTVAVVGGLGISRFFKIDDVVTSIWIGGLILSSALWFSSWIEKKQWHVPHKEILSVFIFYLFVLLPLYVGKTIGIPGNTLWGIDKIILGILIGSLMFLFGVFVDRWLRTTHDGKVYVPYQKVLLPVGLLFLASLILYGITK